MATIHKTGGGHYHTSVDVRALLTLIATLVFLLGGASGLSGPL